MAPMKLCRLWPLLLCLLFLSGCVPNRTSEPQSHLLLGNPSGAGVVPGNYLLEREAFATSYNAFAKGPNWVAWHLEASDLGKAPRGEFEADPQLPQAWRVNPGDYSRSGYDRGHLCPSGDRTRDVAYNQQTFVMSNMLPQAAALNHRVWGELENYCRSLVRDSGQELYIIAGGSGTAGRIGKRQINIPNICWKIIVALPRGDDDLARINSKTRVIAVAIPNRNRKAIADSSWRDWTTTVAHLEKTTGYDFLATLPDDIEKTLSAKSDKSGDKPEAAPQPAAAPPDQVWVNTKSGVYHRPGMRYYGLTKQGRYMSEKEARAKGYRPAPS